MRPSCKHVVVSVDGSFDTVLLRFDSPLPLCSEAMPACNDDSTGKNAQFDDAGCLRPRDAHAGVAERDAVAREAQRLPAQTVRPMVDEQEQHAERREREQHREARWDVSRRHRQQHRHHGERLIRMRDPRIVTRDFRFQRVVRRCSHAREYNASALALQSTANPAACALHPEPRTGRDGAVAFANFEQQRGEGAVAADVADARVRRDVVAGADFDAA